MIATVPTEAVLSTVGLRQSSEKLVGVCLSTWLFSSCAISSLEERLPGRQRICEASRLISSCVLCSKPASDISR